jgi:hypothetical protein
MHEILAAEPISALADGTNSFVALRWWALLNVSDGFAEKLVGARTLTWA